MLARTLCSLVAAIGLVALAPQPASAREVMGFLPSWERDAKLRWDVLDVVAYFNVGVRPDGSLGDPGTWPDDPAVAALIERAEQEGARVVLTVTNFVSSEISSLVQSADARARFIDEIVPMVLGAGGHGVNIDLENVAGEDREAFTLFVTEVAAAFHNADPDSHVSVAVPAVDWSNVFDTAALLEAADAIFIMGYDYHWRGGSTAGPVAPLASGTLWNERLNLGRTIADYTSQIARADHSRLILGLPLYGYSWPTASDEAGAATADDADSVFFRDWAAGRGDDEILWDVESATPWFAYQEAGSWRQVWGEDVVSIAAKLDLAVEHDLGIGFWALGYADTERALWDAIADRAGDTPPPPPPDAGPGPSSDAGADPGADIGGGGCAAGGGSGAAGALALLGAMLATRGPSNRDSRRVHSS